MGALQTPRVLWFGILMSSVMFVVVALLAAPAPSAPPEPMLLPVFGLVSVGLAAASFLLPAKLREQATRAFDVPARPEAMPDAAGGSEILPAAYRAPTATRLVAVDPAAARSRALALFNTPFILSLALSEAIAMFGLVATFLGHPLVYALPFFVTGSALIGIRFPTWDRVLGPMERARNIHVPRP